MRNITNPVLHGFNPDPSIMRVGEDYYLAVSTFEWFPGITIYHSRNLSDWEFIAAPLTEDYIDMTGIDAACGIWAPNLTYSDGKFYLAYTLVYTNRKRYKDTHNFLITADDVRGPWSEPVYLNCSGFDPSIFHDDDGKKWIVNMTIDHRVERERFSGIDIQEYDQENNCVTGPVYRIFRGTHLHMTEGPNILKHNGYYYLTCAEGGTEFEHAVTVCRSRNITGPYEVDPNNPMLSAHADETYPIQRAGHGQLVETPDGEWYMAHLCSRPVDRCSILGRETAIQNIEWTEDGWYRLAKGGRLPHPEYTVNTEPGPHNAHPTGREDFDDGTIPWQFLTLRESAKSCGISATERPGWIRIHGGNSLTCKYKQAFMARRLQDFYCDVTTKVQFNPRRYQHLAGLTVFYNYDNYHYLRLSTDEETGRCICVTSVENMVFTESEYIDLPDEIDTYYLKAEIRRETLQYYYSIDGETFYPVGGTWDMKAISDERVEGNGFTGAMVGICCQDLQGDGCYADFDWFEYTQLDM